MLILIRELLASFYARFWLTSQNFRNFSYGTKSIIFYWCTGSWRQLRKGESEEVPVLEQVPVGGQKFKTWTDFFPILEAEKSLTSFLVLMTLNSIYEMIKKQHIFSQNDKNTLKKLPQLPLTAGTPIKIMDSFALHWRAHFWYIFKNIEGYLYD